MYFIELEGKRRLHCDLDLESFITMRELTAENKEVLIRVQKLEGSHDRTASVIEILVDDFDRIANDLKQLKKLPLSTRRKIGFDL
jgi:hypothetical protein